MAPVESTKVGPNDKCVSAAEAPTHTPIQSPSGQVLPGSADELLSLAVEAAKAGEDVKAGHMYTMGIDSLAKGMKKDKNGVASDADLRALNASSKGQLAQLLSGRSNIYLRQGDVDAAVEDADTCTRADPKFERGHLRLAVAYEKAGAPLERQLAACEKGLDECPSSEFLVKRKWHLKKAIAALPESAQAKEAQTEQQQEPWTIEQTRLLANDLSDPRRAMAATDLGIALFMGAHGLSKDLKEAERYLRVGAEGGDISARRYLGLALLDLERPVEAADELSLAANAGDEDAAGILNQLGSEAKAREQEALKKLQEMAELGDPRAIRMLEELRT